MPQPSNSAPSARKQAARKPAEATQPNAGGAGAGGEHAPPGEDDDALLAALAGVRDLLGRGVTITADRLQETVDEAVRRGRMTRADAEELVQNLVDIGRRQAQDALAELERIVERSAQGTRRLAQSRVKSVSSAARWTPSTDRALRTVDRVRRAAGIGPSFPVTGYDELTAAQVKERLADLSSAELRKVRDHERRNANRKSVLTAIEQQLG